MSETETYHTSQSETQESLKTAESFTLLVAPGWTLTLMITLQMFFGVGSVMLLKTQNRNFLPVDAYCDATDINRSPPADDLTEEEASEWTCFAYHQAPMFQTLLMYIGEWFCQIIWLSERAISKRYRRRPVLDLATSRQSIQKVPCPVYWWLIPCFLDWFGSTLRNVAVVMSYMSTVQLLRNFNVIMTAMLLMFYVKRALRAHNWIGSIIVTTGMILTGLYGVLYPDTHTNNSIDQGKAIFAVLLAVLSCVIHACQGVFEEKLFRRYFVSPFEAVGWMGLFGIPFAAAFVGIGQATGLEDTKITWYQMTKSGPLIAEQIGYIFMAMGYNGTAVSVTKLGSSVLRAVVSASRSVVVWIFDISLGWAPFNLLSFFGMLFVVVGALIYQVDMIYKPCPPLHRWCRRPWMCGSYLINPDRIAKETSDGTVLEKYEEDQLETARTFEGEEEEEE